MPHFSQGLTFSSADEITQLKGRKKNGLPGQLELELDSELEVADSVKGCEDETLDRDNLSGIDSFKVDPLGNSMPNNSSSLHETKAPNAAVDTVASIQELHAHASTTAHFFRCRTRVR